MHVERKASAKSALHTVLEAITSLPHLALYNGLACLAECIEKEHGVTLVMHKTTTGILQWCQEMSSCRRLGYVPSINVVPVPVCRLCDTAGVCAFPPAACNPFPEHEYHE